MQKGEAALERDHSKIGRGDDIKARSLKNVFRDATRIWVGIAAALLFLLPIQALRGRDHLDKADVQVGVQDGQMHIYDGTWSGYFAMPRNIFGSQPNVTGVIGTWIVPRTGEGCKIAGGSIDGNKYGFVQWAGIGGIGIRGRDRGVIPLIQVGIESDVVDRKTTYFVGYELVPQYPQRIRFSVSAGDIVYGEIRLIDGTNNYWKIEFRDITQNEHFSRVVRYKAARTSAEWMIERPISAVYGTLQFPSFSQASFISDGLFLGNYATIDGVSGPISAFRYVAVDMDHKENGKSPTQTSLLGPGGVAFSIRNEIRCER